jgi:CRP/FNR family transcriptional regulator, polysaccharide utilization system transcription regulator
MNPDMKTILMIEDDPDMLQITSEILELEGYNALKAPSGPIGLAMAREQLPDLVLCDINMSQMDGYGVLHELSREVRTAEIPFIFLSGKAERADVRKGMDMGADDYLTKPIKADELLAAVEGRLRRNALFRRDFSDGLEGLDRFMDTARGVEVLKNLGKGRKRHSYKEGEVLFREGDALEDVPYIVKGKVRTSKLNKDEKEFNTGFYGPAEFLGFTGLLEFGRAAECAVAVEATEVVSIPSEELFALLHRDPDVSNCFIKLLAHDVEDRKVHMLQLAYASIRQRVAQSLLRIHDRYAEAHEPGLGIRISRENLASVVGTATESLIRCLSDLKEETMISVEGRDIRILDKPRLEKLAHL